MTGPLPIARLTHVALRTADIDASIKFYEQYAGFVISHDRVDSGFRQKARVVWMSEPVENPDYVLVIMGGSPEVSAQPPMAHLGFAVLTHDDVTRLAEKAKGEGILVQGPVQYPPPVGYFCIMKDPSGNCVEFSFDQPISAHR